MGAGTQYIKTFGNGECVYPAPDGSFNCASWQQVDQIVTPSCYQMYVPDAEPTNPDPNIPPTGGGGGGTTNPTYPVPSKTALLSAIYNKPYSLFSIPCHLVVQWIDLAKFSNLSLVSTKVHSLTGNVATQTGSTYGIPTSHSYVSDVLDINDAYSSVVNLDYFSVNITTLPIVNGQRLTPQQLLNYIRLRLNSFVNTGYSKFIPYNYYGVDDRALWNSSNPSGAIISIEIPGNYGSVITSSYKPSSWIFSTISDPYNGSHPVSGNREFGYTANPNGSFTFYTKGVDRITDPFTTLLQNGTGIPFKSADALWDSFQDGIVDFVKSHQGASTKGTVYKYRPDWVLVKDVMDGKQPLSTLSNDCK